MTRRGFSQNNKETKGKTTTDAPVSSAKMTFAPARVVAIVSIDATHDIRRRLVAGGQTLSSDTLVRVELAVVLGVVQKRVRAVVGVVAVRIRIQLVLPIGVEDGLVEDLEVDASHVPTPNIVHDVVPGAVVRGKAHRNNVVVVGVVRCDEVALDRLDPWVPA